MSTGQVKKWGNSLAIRLPKEVVDKLGVVDGMNIQIEIHDLKKEVTIRPQRKVIPPLDELVKQITPENLHPLFDWGKPRGNEFW